MLSYLSKKTRRIRAALGIANDAWNALMALGIASIPAAIMAYLSWAKDNPSVVLLFVLAAFALSAAITNSIMAIAERVRIFRRIKLQQLEPHVIELKEDKFALTAKARLVNRAQVPVEMYIRHVSQNIEGQSSPETTPNLAPIFALPNDFGCIIIATIVDIPRKPHLRGTLYLDVGYGMEGEAPEYRFEHRCDVEAVMAPGSFMIGTQNDRTSHTHLAS
jgi:hypothetical protein